MSTRHTLAVMAFLSALAPAGAVLAQAVPDPSTQCPTSDPNCITPDIPAPTAGPESNSGLGTGTLPGSVEPGNTAPSTTGIGTNNGLNNGVNNGVLDGTGNATTGGSNTLNGNGGATTTSPNSNSGGTSN